MRKERIVLEMQYVESADNDYTLYGGSLYASAYGLYSMYKSLPKSDRERRMDVYCFNTIARKPETEEERRLLEEEVDKGLAINVDGWYAPTDSNGSPEEYAIDLIWVVKDYVPVYIFSHEVTGKDYDEDFGGVSIPVTIAGNSYIIHAQVGIDEDGDLFRVYLSDEHAADYRTDVEDANGKVYDLDAGDSVPVVNDNIWYEILVDAIPDEGPSSFDVKKKAG